MKRTEANVSGHEYITVRLRAACVPSTDPGVRALLNEAATVIVGRDAAIQQSAAFQMLKGIVSHWDEFGHGHGLDQRMDAARSFVQRVGE